MIWIEEWEGEPVGEESIPTSKELEEDIKRELNNLHNVFREWRNQ